jgi:hypothetical protein
MGKACYDLTMLAGCVSSEFDGPRLDAIASECFRVQISVREADFLTALGSGRL